MTELSKFIANIVHFLIQPILGLLFAAAIFAFVGGVGVFFDLKGNDPKERDRGKQVLLWGIAGFFIMVTAVSIIAVVTRTFCPTAFCK